MAHLNIFSVFFFLVIAFASHVSCDGDPSHTHSHAATASDVKDDTVSSTSVHSASSKGLNKDDLASIVQSISQNPQLAAAAASAVRGPSAVGYDYPSPPLPRVPGYPYGGFGGAGLLPWGIGKNFNLNLDAGVGGVGAYFPIIEKVIVVIGGGILILLIIAFIQGSISVGGFLNNLGGSFSKALAGAVDVDVGPIHKSASAAGAVNFGGGVNNRPPLVNDPRFNGQVQNAINQRF